MSEVVWTTETPPQPVQGPRRCMHGKDAGQTCYPCDVYTDSSEQSGRKNPTAVTA